MKPKYSDWIALYECSSDRNLEKFVAVETNLMVRSPTKCDLNSVVFHKNQLKNVKCNLEYEFLYGNKFNEVIYEMYQITFSYLKCFILTFIDLWNKSINTFHS